MPKDEVSAADRLTSFDFAQHASVHGMLDLHEQQYEAASRPILAGGSPKASSNPEGWEILVAVKEEHLRAISYNQGV